MIEIDTSETPVDYGALRSELRRDMQTMPRTNVHARPEVVYEQRGFMGPSVLPSSYHHEVRPAVHEAYDHRAAAYEVPVRVYVGNSRTDGTWGVS